MNSWKIILATIVIFGAGVITGGLLVSHVDHTRPHRPKATDAPTNSLYSQLSANALRKSNAPPLLERRLDFLRKVSAELNLTADQKKNVEAILCDSQERVKKIWDCISPQLRDEINASREKIRAELTAEQCKCFEELLKRTARRSEDSTNHPPHEVRKSLAENQTNTVPLDMILQAKP